MPDFLDKLIASAETLWEQATEIWFGGGWAMVAIAVIALLMFSVGFRVLFKLRGKGFNSVPERVWRRWIDHPLERKGQIGDLLDVATGGRSLDEIAICFDEMRKTETVPIERDLRVMKICVSAAPLVGLLGTVTGMLTTFGALAGGSGGDKTMEMVASGISEALITTETGLVIALPGLFFQYQLVRLHERYKAFLAHLESVCTQNLRRELQADRRRQIQRAARRVVARKLSRRMRTSPESTPEPEPEPAQTPTPPRADDGVAQVSNV